MSVANETVGRPPQATYFTTGGPRYEPTELSRGPWAVGACHAGPPAAALAREMEQLRPDSQLTRLTVELARPVPIAGFTVTAELVHGGRTVSTSQATLVDDDGRVCARATGLLLSPAGPFDYPTGSSDQPHPAGSLSDAQPGPFAITKTLHGQTSIIDGGLDARYPPGHSGAVGPTTVWLRTLPLVPDEEPSPFQRVCTVADCSNALSRNAEPWEVSFLNADLTVSLHRLPDGAWLGSQVSAHWQPNGIGVADALLFDERGAVGRALQTLVLRPSD